MTSSEQEVYNQIRIVAKQPEAIDFSVPEEVIINQAKGEIAYQGHLFEKPDGTYTAKLNTWEDSVIRAEIDREDFVGWIRNYERKPWSLCVPYEKMGQTLPMYPDFIVVRRADRGEYIVDLLEPHRTDLEDVWSSCPRVINEVLKDVEPGVTIQFNQMDITDLRSDAEFFQRMLKAGVYQPDEVRALLEAVVE